MPLSDGLLLFHGSYVPVPEPDLTKCARFKDFGRGFYLTTSREQALSFARLSTRKALERRREGVQPDRGFVSAFSVKSDVVMSLAFLEFPDADADWLRCVVAHRRRGGASDVVERLSEYDVIAGKIANDQTNITITLYMDGIFGPVGSAEAIAACTSRLLPERLEDQYCFRSEKAIRALSFEGSETAWM